MQGACTTNVRRWHAWIYVCLRCSSTEKRVASAYASGCCPHLRKDSINSHSAGFAFGQRPTCLLCQWKLKVDAGRYHGGDLQNIRAKPQLDPLEAPQKICLQPCITVKYRTSQRCLHNIRLTYSCVVQAAWCPLYHTILSALQNCARCKAANSRGEDLHLTPRLTKQVKACCLCHRGCGVAVRQSRHKFRGTNH